MKDKDILICRCEEISLQEIKDAIRDGARTVTEIKRRTRAGMGLCQGRSCERLIQQILKQELGAEAGSNLSATDRPPVRPISFGTMGGDKNEDL